MRLMDIRQIEEQLNTYLTASYDPEYDQKALGNRAVEALDSLPMGAVVSFIGKHTINYTKVTEYNWEDVNTQMLRNVGSFIRYFDRGNTGRPKFIRVYASCLEKGRDERQEQDALLKLSYETFREQFADRVQLNTFRYTSQNTVIMAEAEDNADVTQTFIFSAVSKTWFIPGVK